MTVGFGTVDIAPVSRWDRIVAVRRYTLVVGTDKSVVGRFVID